MGKEANGKTVSCKYWVHSSVRACHFISSLIRFCATGGLQTAQKSLPLERALDGTASSMRSRFPFVHKPNTPDRDRIVVPAGWVSWGKIYEKVLDAKV